MLKWILHSPQLTAGAQDWVCAMTDATFKTVKRYPLAVLHLIFNMHRGSIPLRNIHSN
jgi:hypothetical protein